jgi:uncharacterized protein (DUF58 family)
VALTRCASPRLWAYAATAVAGLFAAIAVGRPEPAIAVAPLVLLAVAGVVLAERPELDARIVLAVDRVSEGQELPVEVELESDLRHVRVDVLVPVHGPLDVRTPRRGGLSWASRGGGSRRRFEGRGRTSRWGVVHLGPVWVRAYGPLGLVRWQGALGPQTTVRVLPSVATLRTLFPHPDPRTAAGAHLARRPGEGLEFADLRPYQPGDRLRSINWPVSTRRQQLWVNERRPERSMELVILVDTFADDQHGGSLALPRAARAAWLLAHAHLVAHDRVGLLGFGGYPSWITPGVGERARYELLDKLLATSSAWTEAPRSVALLPRAALPPGAAIVGITPLHDRRMVEALAELRRRGLSVAAVRVDVHDLLPTPTSPASAAALAIWRLELQRRAEVLDDVGVPVLDWTNDDDAATVLGALRRAGRAPVLRRRPA